MLRAYCAGAISAPTLDEVWANIRRGLKLTRQLKDLGLSPFPTFTNFILALMGEITNEEYYQMDLAWVEVADVVVVVPEGYEKSKGVSLEIEKANALGIPVRIGIAEAQDWLYANNLP
jgi:hypothetical protein